MSVVVALVLEHVAIPLFFQYNAPIAIVNFVVRNGGGAFSLQHNPCEQKQSTDEPAFDASCLLISCLISIVPNHVGTV